jgi:hypothetical protein
MSSSPDVSKRCRTIRLTEKKSVSSFFLRKLIENNVDNRSVVIKILPCFLEADVSPIGLFPLVKNLIGSGKFCLRNLIK